MKTKIFLICCLLAFVSCGKKNGGDEMPMCSCPHCLICIQPLGSFTKAEAEALVPTLEENFGKWLYGGWEFKVLDQKPLSKEAYVKERNGYKAVNILDMLKKNPQKEDHRPIVYIGLAHEDICTDIRDKKNYGIIGLSYSPGYVSVVSDYRVKPRSIVWKSMLHEFMHAFYGAKHCPNDDPKCFMKDAKGKGNLRVQDRLCDSCRY